MHILQANKVVLSERLQAIADFVPNGACVADIGCDHALLSVYLAKTGKAQKVLACDIKEGPLSVARNNVQKTGLEEKIQLRLCNGLDAIAPGEVDTVVIAGMGGEMMVDILARAGWLQNSGVTLVLQPMSRPEVLRAYLYRTGFMVNTERVITENSHSYTLMLVTFTGEAFTPQEILTYVGALPQGGSAEAAYLQALGRRLQNAAKECAHSPRKAQTAQHFAQLAEQIHKIASEMN